MTDHYEVLGCDRTASAAELKKAYRKKALLTHPDKTKSPRDEFLQITEAWRVLKTPESRKAYDDQLSQRELYEASRWDVYKKDQLSWDDTRRSYFHTCRCGGRFEVSTSDAKESVAVDCENCSLSVVFEFDNEMPQ